MINAVIIDDEKASLMALQIKIEHLNVNVKIIKTFLLAADCLAEIEHLVPDVVFLDIEMPVMNGFAFLNQFPNRTFEVIITTAHDEYAIKALRHSAVDFLLKPIIVDDLKMAIERLCQKVEAKKQSTNAHYKKLSAQFDKIPVPSLRGIVFVPIREILYLTSDGNYTTIHLENKTTLVSSRSIGDYENLLHSMGFFRIHHTNLINLIHIKEYLRGEGGSVILSNGAELDVSKRKKKDFLDFLSF